MSEKTKKDNTSSLMIKEKLEELDVIVKMLQMLKDPLEAEEAEVEEDHKKPKEPQPKPRKKKPQSNNRLDKTYLLLISQINNTKTLKHKKIIETYKYNSLPCLPCLAFLTSPSSNPLPFNLINRSHNLLTMWFNIQWYNKFL